MKTVYYLLVLLITCSFVAVPSVDIDISSPVVAAILAGIYEITVRLIPTVKDYTILGKVLKGLKWLSDFLNRSKH